MYQPVDITLTISLWLDSAMDEDDIVTYVRGNLPLAFDKTLTDVNNPVDIIDIKQGPELFGNHT